MPRPRGALEGFHPVFQRARRVSITGW